MAERLPPLKSIHYFAVAARLLSFSKAAEELNVTHSAISHQIKALEEWLGVKLFRRANRQVILTDAGQTYLKPVLEAFERLGDASRQLKRREQSGPLTVSTTPSLAAKWLVPHLRSFYTAHPDIDVRISATGRLTDFDREDVDVKQPPPAASSTRNDGEAEDVLSVVFDKPLKLDLIGER